MAQVEVLQLGNGGGFDFNKTSSAFLVRCNKTIVLVDCGFGIMDTLKTLEGGKYIEDIDAVCITHMHEDHVGNLMSLIYYRYFVLDKKTKVMAGDIKIREALRVYLDPCTSELKSGQVVFADMVDIAEVGRVQDLRVEATPAFHPGIEATGFAFWRSENKSNTVIISGDTKANYALEEFTLMHARIYYDGSLANINVYHDFSNWNNVSQNVHACATDIATEYSAKFIARIKHYHTGEDFISKWM